MNKQVCKKNCISFFDKWWFSKQNVLYHFYDEDRYNEIMKSMAKIFELSGALSLSDEEVYDVCEDFVRHVSKKTGEHKGLLADFVDYLKD